MTKNEQAEAVFQQLTSNVQCEWCRRWFEGSRHYHQYFDMLFCSKWCYDMHMKYRE